MDIKKEKVLCQKQWAKNKKFFVKSNGQKINI